MAELTKEYLDKSLQGLVTQVGLEEAFNKQAILINNAFQTHSDHFDSKLEEVKDELKTDISRVESKVDQALHVEYTNLEVRVKRIENKLGMKPVNQPSPN